MPGVLYCRILAIQQPMLVKTRRLIDGTQSLWSASYFCYKQINLNMTTNYFSNLKQAIVLIACSIFYHLPLSAQKLAPAAGFQHELALDFSMPLHGFYGSSILYKQQIGTPKIKNWQKNQALRGMIGLYREDIATSGRHFIGDSITLANSFDGRNKGAFLHIGFEVQASKKRFRLYGGGDLGYRYINSKSHSSYEYTKNGTIVDAYTAEGVSNSNIPQVSVFGGANYFFTRHLSIGIEISVPVAIEFTSSETVVSNNPAPRSDNYLNVAVGGDYRPRLLYLSWHFGNEKRKADTPPSTLLP